MTNFEMMKMNGGTIEHDELLNNTLQIVLPPH